MADNGNLALRGRVLEEACPLSRNDGYDDSVIENPCYTCAEKMSCARCFNPDQIVDGNDKRYNEFSGFGSVVPPGSITVDLGAVKEVGRIQFLLWDNRGLDKKEESCRHRYHYRLLVSTDQKCWRVIYDSLREGYCGWQIFGFSRPVGIRYIRIHCIASSEPSEPVRIVQLEAYAASDVKVNNNFPPALCININSPEEVKEAAEKGSGSVLKELFDKVTAELKATWDTASAFPNIRSRIKVLLVDIGRINEEIAMYENRFNHLRQRILSPTRKGIVRSNVATTLGIISTVAGLASIGWMLWNRFG